MTYSTYGFHPFHIWIAFPFLGNRPGETDPFVVRRVDGSDFVGRRSAGLATHGGEEVLFERVQFCGSPFGIQSCSLGVKQSMG